MKSEMHTLIAIAAVIVVIAGVWGSMQLVPVFREGKNKEAAGFTEKVIARETTDGKGMPAVELSVESEKSTDITPQLMFSESNETGRVSELSASGTVAGISYERLVMANVLEAVNIREEASENSAIIGKLYKGCGGEIIEKGDDWTRLKTGEVTGYVSNDYLLFGEEAAELAETVVTRVATSTTSCLRVRTEPNEDSRILGLLAEGDKIDVLEEEGDWVKTEYSDGTECYVSAQYVSIEVELPYGESMEAIQKREEEQKAQQNKVSKEEAKKAGSLGTSNAGTQSGLPQSTTPAISADNVNDVYLLAALIQCEAGNEIHEGQVAIGDVVMNRIRTGRYGSSVYSVVYAKSQFGPAGSGMVAQVYANGPKASCIAAAQEAMSGVNYIGTATSFRNVNSGHVGVVVGNHVFW
ncbi:MAG: SH3 domain-containing protein [Lachnospiraceae bacterium]|nr:SH3 domain-containing protein [Lachnospiraceae bacterium]